MNEPPKTRILETLEQPATAEQLGRTRILGEATPTLREETLAAELPEPGLLNAPPRTRWPARLGKLVGAIVIGVGPPEWTHWILAAGLWQPLAGTLVGLIGLGVAGTGLKALTDVPRQL